jgi:uncharacterized protein (DUF2062 family)
MPVWVHLSLHDGDDGANERGSAGLEGFFRWEPVGVGDTLRRLLWFHNFFLLGGLERAVRGRESDLASSDSATGKYRDVTVCFDSTFFSDTGRTGWRAVSPKGGMKEGFLTRRLIRPLLELLRQGVTPEKLALSIALGAALGLIPALGWSAILCALMAFFLRLNLPAIQMVNYFMYPGQVALLIPFFKLGEKLFGAPHLPISVSQIYAMARANLWGAIKFLWGTTWHAIVVWALLAPFLVAAIYFLLAPAFRRVRRGQEKAQLAAAEVKVA